MLLYSSAPPHPQPLSLGRGGVDRVLLRNTPPLPLGEGLGGEGRPAADPLFEKYWL